MLIFETDLRIILSIARRNYLVLTLTLSNKVANFYELKLLQYLSICLSEIATSVLNIHKVLQNESKLLNVNIKCSLLQTAGTVYWGKMDLGTRPFKFIF